MLAIGEQEFDPLAAVVLQRRRLPARARRIDRLLDTIEHTIVELTEKHMDDKVTDKELYAGFTDEQKERYEREVREQYDPELVAESNRRVRKMSKAQWAALQQEGEAVHVALAALMGRPVDDADVQALIARHYAMLNQFYPVSAEIYSGLGQLYITNDEFRAFYDKIKPGLAGFLQPAMAYFAEHAL